MEKIYVVKMGEIVLTGPDGSVVSDPAFVKEAGGFTFFGDSCLEAITRCPYTVSFLWLQKGRCLLPSPIPDQRERRVGWVGELRLGQLRPTPTDAIVGNSWLVIAAGSQTTQDAWLLAAVKDSNTGNLWRAALCWCVCVFVCHLPTPGCAML